MDRDSRNSYRDRTRANQTDERNEYDWPATPRSGRRASVRDERPRDGMSPPPRSGAPGGAGRPSRAGSPSDPGSRRPGNGNGNGGNGGYGGGGYGRPPITANGAPGDDGDEYGPRSRPGNAVPGRGSGYGQAQGRGGRPDDTPDRSSRAPAMAGARMRGRGDEDSSGRRRSMASMARDVSRSMSRQLGAALSRTGRAIRDAGAPPVRGVTPPPSPSRRVAVPAEVAEKLGSQPYRRSRARMVAAKWRRGRVPPNPLLVIGGMLLGLFLVFVTVFAGGAGFLYAYNYYQYHLADIQAIANLKYQSSSIIYDRNGTQLYTVHNDQGYQIYVPLSQISEKVQWATIDIEDRTFYSNLGVDPQGTLRALTVDLKSGDSTQGASTITQQLVKNIVLHDSAKAVQRKINEAILAYGVTQQYTKAQILEMYLNTIPYGDQNQGIEAAARNFFGLAPQKLPDGSTELANQQLSWAQAAILAGLPNAPTLYLPIQFSCTKAPCQVSQWADPFQAGHECDENYFIPGFDSSWYLVQGHEWLVYCRASAVLHGMLNPSNNAMPAGLFTQADLDTALQQVQSILINQQIYHWAGQTNGSANNATIKLAPSFVDYVVEQLSDEWGISDLETGGYKIYTTLDYNLEKFAEQNLAYYIDQPHQNPWYGVGGCGGLDCPLSQTGNAHDGALVAIDQHTGDILAMVGTVDYNNKDPRVAGNVNITTSGRSLGSATKPLVYATAFQEGWTPGIMLQDEPICFPVPVDPTATNPATPGCKGWYSPVNYENANFSGPFPARYVLGNSMNIPATEVMSYVGDTPDTSAAFLDMTQRLGVTSYTQQAMGPTTALGTQDMSLLQLTGAYAVFANGGKRAVPRAILRIEKSDGTVLYPTADTPAVPQTAQVISPQAAYMITSILTDNNARAEEFGARQNPLHWEPTRGENYTMALAAKTGTSSGPTGPRDIVTMGYTPYLTLGVWMGNANGDSMTGGIIGIAGAGYTFHDVMLWALQHYHWDPNAQFAIPPDMAQAKVNCDTGLAPYKGEAETSPDLRCTYRPYAPKTSANLYNNDTGRQAITDNDWYIADEPWLQS